MTETKTDVEETTSVSTKRQVTAVVASTAVTVVLGVVANALIAKVATRVHEVIIPKNDSE
jgi:hypothetical protein